MNTQKKAAPKDSKENYEPNSLNQSTKKQPPFKIELALNSILHNGPRGITQPEAQATYRESCLHTTISVLRHSKGIEFISHPDQDTVVYYNQKPFSRYWLASDEDRKKALKLLNAYRANRGLPKVNYGPWHSSPNEAA